MAFIDKLKEIKPGRAELHKKLINYLVSNQSSTDAFDSVNENFTDSTKLLGNQIWPGSIYIFEYSSKFPANYEKVENAKNNTSKTKQLGKKKNILFSDTSPLLLVLKQDENTISGFNLNICNRGLKILLLNILYNMDTDFFSGGASKLCNAGQLPLSRNILTFFQRGDVEQQIVHTLKRNFPNVDFSAVIRTYSKANIKHIKYIEPFLWEELPYFDYHGSINPSILSELQIKSGISTIKV